MESWEYEADHGELNTPTILSTDKISDKAR